MQPATQSTGSVFYLVDGIIDPIQQQHISPWEFNSTTATISQEKQLEKWVFIMYV